MAIKRKSDRKPKTHSEILWHFTGGPQWNSKKQCQKKTLKPASTAYKTLLAILESKKLKVGNYSELIKLIVPKKRTYDPKKRNTFIRNNVPVEIFTSKVCCVADIPLSELFHHAKRYGKIAIGFKREKLIAAGFNPVFYTLDNRKIVQHYYSAQDALESVDGSSVETELDNFASEIEYQLPHSIEIDIDTSNVSSEIDFLSENASTALGNLKDAMAFVKTFNANEFDTIYSEREWRSVNEYCFDWNHIEYIILPRGGRNSYMTKFKRKDLIKLKVPNSIKILSWEDI